MNGLRKSAGLQHRFRGNDGFRVSQCPYKRTHFCEVLFPHTFILSQTGKKERKSGKSERKEKKKVRNERKERKDG